MIELLAAAIVGAALLWIVLQPIVSPSVQAPIDIDPPDPEETPRGQALLALKEIEFDRATGKLSDDDYTALNAKYTAAAIATLDVPQAPLSTGSASRCLVHGQRAEAGALFCADCGAGLVTDAGACAACAAPIPANALFCPGCGVRLTAALAGL